MLTNLFRGLISTIGFFTKELIGVIRQPRLIASLILGPFVILLLFGLGFRGQHPEFRTILVLPNDPSISADPAGYSQAFSGVFKLQEVTRDEAHARAALRADQTDVVVIVPPNVADRVYSGTQAALPVLYSETDPTEGAWVKYFAYVQVSELNRRVLVEILRQSKGPASQAVEFGAQTRGEIDGLDTDIRGGNYASAAVRVGRLLATVQAARAGLAKALDELGAAGTDPSASGQATAQLQGMEQELLGFQQDLAMGPAGLASAQRRVENLRTANRQFDDLARRVDSIPPETLVSPFVADTRNELPVEPTAIAFYTPAVLALLLQHIGVTFSVLSTVRDRLLGSLELFRVSPVGPGNILMGKTLAYAVVLAVVSIALTTAATLLLGVPSLGVPFYYWLSLGLTVFAAVALGFALSAMAQNESQAVQLSMLALLASVFFGGFFLRLDQLWPQVHVVSYLLPVTYGAQDLREVMLRGVEPAREYLLGPLALGLVYFAIGIVAVRHQMRRA